MTSAPGTVTSVTRTVFHSTCRKVASSGIQRKFSKPTNPAGTPEVSDRSVKLVQTSLPTG